MNILVVSETEYIKKVVHEYQIIPETLASMGHDVFVIDYPAEFHKKHFFDLGSFKTQKFKNIKKANKRKGITLIRPGIIKIPVVSRIVAFVEYFFIIPKIIKKKQIDKIIMLSAPTNGLQTLFWAKIFKIPILFRLIDVLHLLAPFRFLQKLAYLSEKIIYPRVSAISANTKNLKNYAIKMGGKAKTTYYLASGADKDIFFPGKKDKKLIKKYKFSEKDIIILFAGTLYNFSGLDILLNYFAKNITKHSNIKFLIAGKGEQELVLKNIIKKYNLSKNVKLLGFIQYDNLSKYINLADICTNPFIKNNLTDPIFPGKIYQYLACSKPVIATKLRGTLELFPDKQGKNNIYYFNIDKPQEFFSTIKKINNKQFVDNNLSLNEISKKIEEKLIILK